MCRFAIIPDGVVTPEGDDDMEDDMEEEMDKSVGISIADEVIKNLI
jgi:hypothetical protein